MSRFKKGDRILVASDVNPEYYAKGDTGTVYRIDHNGDLWVEFDENNWHPQWYNLPDSRWCISAHKVQRLTDKRYFMIIKDVSHTNMSRGDVVELADDDGSDMKLYSILGGSHGEFSMDKRYIRDHDLEEVIGYSESAPVIENDSQPSIRKLKIKSCVFTDANGDTITIKRSPCRHYYLKAPGKKQKRIKKQQLAGILTGLSAAL